MPWAMQMLARIARVWRRRPVLSLAVALTFALALASTVMMWSVLHAVGRRALVYPNGAELVQFVDEAPEPGTSGTALAVTRYADWRAQTSALRQLAAFSSGDATVSAQGRTSVVSVTSISGNLLTTLGVRPVAGRLPTIADESAEPCVAVASRQTAVTQFGGVRAALDKSVSIEGRTCSVAGVVDDGVGFPDAGVALYQVVPARAEISMTPEGRPRVSIRHMQVLGLPRAGARHAQVRAEAAQYFTRQGRARSLQDALTVSYQRTLLSLSWASVLVLVIAVLNIAALLAVSALQRVREWAIKACLGAQPRDLLRDAITDAAALIVPGLSLGLALAAAAIERIREVGPSELATLNLPGWLASFWVVTGVVLCVGAALPAWWQSSRLAATGAATIGAAGTAAATQRHARTVASTVGSSQLGTSVVIQAIVLLLVAVVATTLFRHRGFAADDVLVVPTFRQPEVSPERYAAALDGFRRSLEATGAAASIALDLPVPTTARAFSLRGETEARGTVVHTPQGSYRLHVVGAGYFDVMRMPMRAGRGIGPDDVAGAPPVAVVSRSFAVARLGGEAKAPGARVPLGDSYVLGGTLSVVGVVDDVRRSMWDDAPLPVLYVPLAQLAPPFLNRQPALSRLVLLSRGASANQVRAASEQAPAGALLGDVRSIWQARLQEVAQLVLYMTIAAALGTLTLLITAMGVFAIASDQVLRRLGEFAVRQSMGATPATAVRPLLWYLGRWWGAALMLGGVAALVLTRRVLLVLPDIAIPALLVTSTSLVLVAMCCLIGVLVPLRVALRVQPARLLRAE